MKQGFKFIRASKQHVILGLKPFFSTAHSTKILQQWTNLKKSTITGGTTDGTTMVLQIDCHADCIKSQNSVTNQRQFLQPNVSSKKNCRHKYQ